MPKIVIVLSEGYADWESALLAAVVRGFYGAEVLTASPDGAVVTSMGGYRVTPDLALSAIDPETTDMLVFNGGTAWSSDAPPDIAALAKNMVGLGKPVAAICAAVDALAATGLLDDRAHTGNSKEVLAGIAGYHGAGHFLDQPHAVTDKGVITAPGIAPVSFMTAVCAALGIGGEQFDFYVGRYAAEHRAA